MGRTVAEDLADLVKRRPGSEHSGCKGVSQDVRPLEGRVQPNPIDRSADNRSEGSGVGELPVGRLGENEKTARRAVRAMVPDVVGYG
jgi:hypothetical protein